ncbi:hypothetical protein [Streptomyces phaeochromogenes]
MAVWIFKPWSPVFGAAPLPGLTPFVRLMFPAYACEFPGGESLGEAETRYRMLHLNHLGREPLPFLKMRFADTRT